MNCKYCDSSNVVKYGKVNSVQRYWCKDCERKFADNNALPKMKTPVRVIASALSCCFGGMALDAVQRHLQQQYGRRFSEIGIYNWVKRFSQEAIARVGDFEPTVGNTWVGEETILKVQSRNVWFWDIIDLDSRYLLVSHISMSRIIEDEGKLREQVAVLAGDSRKIIEQAIVKAGKVPRFILTNKLAAAQDGFNLVIDNLETGITSRTGHIAVKGLTSEISTNLMEQFHEAIKDRVSAIRGFRNMELAKTLTEAWQVHYNFFREDTASGDTPPAQKMGTVPFKSWADIVEGKRIT